MPEIKDFDVLDGTVLQAVRRYLGLDEDDTSEDDLIKKMSPDELFERFMTMNGIIGFEGDILRAINDIRDAFAKTRAPDEWPFESEFIF